MKEGSGNAVQNKDVGAVGDRGGEILRERAGIAPIAAMRRIVAVEPGEPFFVFCRAIVVAVALVGGDFSAEAAVGVDAGGHFCVFDVHDAQ